MSNMDMKKLKYLASKFEEETNQKWMKSFPWRRFSLCASHCNVSFYNSDSDAMHLKSSATLRESFIDYMKTLRHTYLRGVTLHRSLPLGVSFELLNSPDDVAREASEFFDLHSAAQDR